MQNDSPYLHMNVVDHVFFRHSNLKVFKLQLKLSYPCLFSMMFVL